MKILIRHVGGDEPPQSWPKGWAVPRVGDLITYPDGSDWTVRHVVWYPKGGGDDGADTDPYVYVIAHEG